MLLLLLLLLRFIRSSSSRLGWKTAKACAACRAAVRLVAGVEASAFPVRVDPFPSAKTRWEVSTSSHLRFLPEKAASVGPLTISEDGSRRL